MSEMAVTVEELLRLRWEDVKALTLEQAKAELSSVVYDATQLLDELESAGKVSGNGHHCRQQLAKSAADLLDSRWACPSAGDIYHHEHTGEICTVRATAYEGLSVRASVVYDVPGADIAGRAPLSEFLAEWRKKSDEVAV